MENLPYELMRRILLHLIEKWRWFFATYERVPDIPLAAYATISRKWQSVVEPFTFRNLHLNQPKLNVAEAYNYLTPARLGHIRNVCFDIEFPAHDLHVSTNPEDYDDQIVFNKAVRQLLGLLGRIPPAQKPSISLILSTSPSREHDIPRRPGYGRPEEDKVLAGKLRKTYLELSADWDRNIQGLPEISYFRTEFYSRALVFAPASINLIASKMTRLKKVEWWLDDAEKMDIEVRIRQRTAFAHTLHLLPRSIQHFRLEYVREPPRDRTFQPPSIVPPGATGDILSRELCRFSQIDGLKDFLVNASVDSTILWPESQDPETKPAWPTLEWFHLELNDLLPSGEWIDMRDPEGDDELMTDSIADEYLESEIPGEEYETRFECTYNPRHFEPFALATARAAGHMPKIMDLSFGYYSSAFMGVGFVTNARKEPCLVLMGDSNPPEPSEETMDAWRNAVKVHGLEWNVQFAEGESSYLYSI